MTKKPRIGFIGQGYVGKGYADDFEDRGFTIVRYALEKPYVENKEDIKECDIVFVAVPTPTTPDGFDDGIVRDVMSLVGKGATAVIKSTVLPGTTESIQKENPDLFVLFSPEFLLEVTAKEDAANPIMNVIGIPEDTKEYREKAEEVLNVLPKSPHTQVCGAKEAEIIKYTHNCRAYGKIIFSNLFYDLSNALGCNWEDIEKAMDADPMFSNWYNKPVHKGGRGAGGHCFVKDFAAFRAFYEKNTNDDIGVDLLKEFEEKNKELLIASKKNPELLKEVYGIGE